MIFSFTFPLPFLLQRSAECVPSCKGVEAVLMLAPNQFSTFYDQSLAGLGLALCGYCVIFCSMTFLSFQLCSICVCILASQIGRYLHREGNTICGPALRLGGHRLSRRGQVAKCGSGRHPILVFLEVHLRSGYV